MTTPATAVMNVLITVPILKERDRWKNRQDCIYPVGIPDSFLSLFELQGAAHKHGGPSPSFFTTRRGVFAISRAEIIAWNNKERDLRLSDLPAETQEFLEDYMARFIPRNRVVYHWFDVYDLEEERL